MKIYTVTNHFASSVRQMFQEFGDVELLPKDYGRLEADLIVFTGGEDINPKFYRSSSESQYDWYDNPRDKWEIAVGKDILSGKILAKKVLGICRGHQLLNVLFGGTLVQDILTYYGKSHDSIHPLTWTAPNGFQGIFDEVNSLHHQGILEVGAKVEPKILAYEPRSQLYEIVLWGNKYLGVQFHPEFMGETGRRGARVIADWITGNSLAKVEFRNKKKPTLEKYAEEYARVNSTLSIASEFARDLPGSFTATNPDLDESDD